MINVKKGQLEFFAQRGRCQFDMLYALQGHHPLSCFSHILPLAPEHHNLQTIIMIQMDVQTGLN